MLCLCGSLNETGPLRFIYLNAWSLDGGTVWEGLEDVVLSKEACRGGGLEVSKACIILCSFCHVLVDRDISSVSASVPSLPL